MLIFSIYVANVEGWLVQDLRIHSEHAVGTEGITTTAGMLGVGARQL